MVRRSIGPRAIASNGEPLELPLGVPQRAVSANETPKDEDKRGMTGQAARNAV